MIRAIIIQVLEGVIKRFSASGRPDETLANREYFQHYGLTSRPLAGAEGIVIREGNHIVMIASDDRRYRLAIESGEVALYDDLEQRVHLTRDGIMVVSPLRIDAQAPVIRAEATEKIEAAAPLIDAQASEKITAGAPEIEATATTKIAASAPNVEVTATVKVVFTSPLVEVSNNLTVGGNATITGNAKAQNVTAVSNVADQNGAKTMAGMRGSYNPHKHVESGAITFAPGSGDQM
jgi:phage gp45-like